MKHPFRYICAVLLLIFTIAFIGCEHTADTEVLDNKSVIPLYDSATNSLIGSDLFTLNTTNITHTATGNYTIREELSQKVTYSNYGTDSQSVLIDQKASYGKHSVNSFQQYVGDLAYWNVDGVYLKSTAQGDLFENKPLPQISNYRTLYGYNAGDYIYLCFYDPVSDSDFSIPQGSSLQEATALIVLKKDGSLLRWQTTLIYCQADTTIYKRFTASPTADHNTFDLTTQNTEFTEVSSLETVMALERVSGFLSSIEPIQAQTVHTITCDANTLERTQTTKIELSGKEEQLTASVDTTVSTVDHSRADTITTEHQLESFTNSLYSLKSDDLIKSSPDVTYDVMDAYCRNSLVVTLPLLRYITDAQVYNRSGTIIYRYTGSQALSELIYTEACKMLYQDPEYLDTLAANRKLLSTECLLHINPLTGLPESSSIEYKGTHSIEGQVYNFTSKTVQTYTFS